MVTLIQTIRTVTIFIVCFMIGAMAPDTGLPLWLAIPAVLMVGGVAAFIMDEFFQRLAELYQ